MRHETWRWTRNVSYHIEVYWNRFASMFGAASRQLSWLAVCCWLVGMCFLRARVHGWASYRWPETRIRGRFVEKYQFREQNTRRVGEQISLSVDDVYIGAKCRITDMTSCTLIRTCVEQYLWNDNSVLQSFVVNISNRCARGDKCSLCLATDEYYVYACVVFKWKNFYLTFCIFNTSSQITGLIEIKQISNLILRKTHKKLQ